MNETEQRALEWLHLAQDGDPKRALVSAVINLRIPRKAGSSSQHACLVRDICVIEIEYSGSNGLLVQRCGQCIVTKFGCQHETLSPHRTQYVSSRQSKPRSFLRIVL